MSLSCVYTFCERVTGNVHRCYAISAVLKVFVSSCYARLVGGPRATKVCVFCRFKLFSIRSVLPLSCLCTSRGWARLSIVLWINLTFKSNHYTAIFCCAATMVRVMGRCWLSVLSFCICRAVEFVDASWSPWSTAAS